MGQRYANQNRHEYFFVTTAFHDWKCYGDLPGVYQAQAKSLALLSEKYSARILGFVLMPSHLHLIPKVDGSDLGNFMRDFKKYIAQKALPDLGVGESPIWKPRFDRVVLTSESVLRTKLNYIHQNPVRAGLVELPEQWEWSSAGDYFLGVAGAVPIWKEWA